MSLKFPDYSKMFAPDIEGISKQMGKIAQQVTINENPLLDNTERSAKAVEQILGAIEIDRQERIKAEKTAKRWQIAGFIIGALTLLATIPSLILALKDLFPK